MYKTYSELSAAYVAAFNSAFNKKCKPDYTAFEENKKFEAWLTKRDGRHVMYRDRVLLNHPDDYDKDGNPNKAALERLYQSYRLYCASSNPSAKTA